MPLKKRIIGSIIIKNGWAVQSFSYKKWLPLGRPENIALNLERWGVDEICIISIDQKDKGPCLEEIEKITKRDKSEIASIIVQKILKKFSINENQSLN